MKRFVLVLFLILSCSSFGALSFAQDSARLNINELEDLQRNPTVSRDVQAEGTSGIFNPYDPQYRPVHYMNTMAQHRKSLTGSRFNLRFIRPTDDNTSDQTAILRFSQTVTIGGCAHMTVPEPDILMNGQMMIVTLPDPVITVQKNKRYAHYECGDVPKEINIDLPLKRASIANDNIKTLLLRNRFGADRYTVDLRDSALSIYPQTTLIFEPAVISGNQDPLQYWFYPRDTIIAEVPTAQGGDVFWEMEQWALTKNLVPLDLKLKGFLQPSQTNKIYYVDESGQTAPHLTRDKMVPVGHIVLKEQWYGSNGPYKKNTTFQITAKKPGLYE